MKQLRDSNEIEPLSSTAGSEKVEKGRTQNAFGLGARKQN